MSSEEEVFKIGKKLEKIIAKREGQTQALDLLKALKEVKITLEVLQKTRIGMTVNNLRKSSSDEEVIALSKTLIRSWKRLLDAQKDGKNTSGNISDMNESYASKSGSSAASNSPYLAKSGDNFNKTHTNTPKSNASGIQQQQQQQQHTKPRQTSFPMSTNTSNDVRLKCREMIEQALRGEALPDDIEVDVEELAAKIEDAIFAEFKDTNMKYKNRIRSRVSNLKDPKNPDLRQNVLRGHIEPSRIAVMSAEEMASDEMKALRQKFTKESINDHQMTLTGGTKTDLIKCPNCKKSNCTYNQVQTRSADEPMTTFCLCNECGKRWKFC
ncbi:transcription elongation factor S-II-like protein [Dinothrombium tinctorium]|uniref:Transcription elongation factor n=1 Tax=Dinothrombium tinctorium TaxID=1965070 RepID=A0A3S3PDV0_9ACAR|nr:transcription elongation factor S-II-like protein [Dinothrombium tinctorium]RWS05729.1 transcription elongation factor S-II-like protein [Dinothrombium tinctorium]RWS06427.1 transcription elongation factor S-II-like protein [Dinothrombium tinctorium]